MIYSIHTLELTLDLNKQDYSKLLKNAYDSANANKHKLYQDDYGVYRDGYLCNKSNKGIKIEYHDDTYTKKIKFIVNPSRVLGGHDLKLWKPTGTNIDSLLSHLKNHIEDYFDGEYGLNSFRLTRMDFTVNINVKNQDRVSAYIKLLHRIGKVKGFSLKYGKDDNRIDKDLSFDLEGNSNGVEFAVYDKEAESGKKDARGILRVEVRLKKPRAIKKKTDKTSTIKQIKDLAGRSKDIFMETFDRIVPVGDYYKKDNAVKLIMGSSFKRKQKEKMLQLIELISEKKSLLLAQKTMNDRNIDSIMGWFAEIGVSPVTISKRMKMEHLESLHSYL